MELLDKLTPALLEIAGVLLSAFAAWLGIQVKAWLDTKQKRDIVEATVKYVEQVGKSVGSEEKFELAQEKALEWLAERGLKVGEVELGVLIESAVNEFFGKYNFVDELGGGSAGEPTVSSVD